MIGENGSVDPVRLTVDDIEELLGSAAAGRPVEEGATYSHLGHALQTATLLRDGDGDGDEGDSGRDRPRRGRGRGREWDELVVAGLVHDIGQLLPGVGDEGHAEAGAAGVRGSLGERVAGLVGLHVMAKRYLVGGEAGYGGGLSPGSVTSLSRQGGPMSSDELSRFERHPLFDDALTLRRADDRGKVDGLVVEGLQAWMEVVRRVAVA
jgi:predicted HD phosphohydrolase